MKHLIIIMACLFVCMTATCAQTDRRPIVGVSAFTCDMESPYVGLVTEKVVEMLTNTQRFQVVDRTSRDRIDAELELQKNEAFLDSKALADQYKAVAAEKIITGHIVKIPVYRVKNPNGTTRGYKGSVAFQMKVVDVETGVSSEATSFEGKTSKECLSPESAVTQSMQSMQKQISEYFRTNVPIAVIPRADGGDVVAAPAPIELSLQHKPKIMVIPYTVEGEDIRTVLEHDVNKRIALTKVKEAFDQRGFTTVDFFGRVKALSRANGLGMEQQQDAKSMIIQQSGADVYIEAETDILNSPTGNAVKVILSAYEISTGNSLANAVGESGKFYTDDFGKLTSRAVETEMGKFMDVIEQKFADIVENGASISITIGFAQGSACSMSSQVGSDGNALSDELELWMEEHAYKNNYHIQGTSDRQMIFDDVRIPLKDENGRNYNINKFGLMMLKFFRSLGLSIERTTSNNMLIVTIK